MPNVSAGDVIDRNVRPPVEFLPGSGTEAVARKIAAPSVPTALTLAATLPLTSCTLTVQEPYACAAQKCAV